jgi:hypothetical protein
VAGSSSASLIERPAIAIEASSATETAAGRSMSGAPFAGTTSRVTTALAVPVPPAPAASAKVTGRELGAVRFAASLD